MGIKIVRTPSETPNITNVDDIIPFRYAYGNQNGYVIGRGSQLDGSYESGEFTVGSGRAVIQGVEVDIDANGISTTLDTASETRYFKIYLKVNLANDVAVLESYYSTVSYDEITDPTSGDLISGGDAYLLLYTLQLSGTTQVEKNKVVKSITYRDAETINGVSITQDNNGVLHSGEEVICKKKLLWSGNETLDHDTFLSIQGLNANTLIGKNLAFLVNKKPLNYMRNQDIVIYCPNFRNEGHMLGDYVHMYSETFSYNNYSGGIGCSIYNFNIDVKILSNDLVFNSYANVYNITNEVWYTSYYNTTLKAIYEIIE